MGNRDNSPIEAITTLKTGHSLERFQSNAQGLPRHNSARATQATTPRRARSQDRGAEREAKE
eukprot:14078499-Alexandrium_andersonii.AAC.1